MFFECFLNLFLCVLCFLRRFHELSAHCCAFGFVSQSHSRQAATSMRNVIQHCTVFSVEASFVASSRDQIEEE